MDPFRLFSSNREVLTLFFSGLGLLLLLVAIVGTWKRKRVANWPSSSGIITESTTVLTGSGGGRAGLRAGSIALEIPRLSYSYTVDGVQYMGHGIAVAATTNLSKQDAVRRIAPYPLGKEVSVYYNPRNPKEACLEKGGVEALLEMGLTGIALIYWGVYCWFYFKTGRPHSLANFFAPLSIGSGLFSLLFGWLVFRKSGEVRRWPSVSGAIAESTVTQQSGSGRWRLWGAKVFYTYVVDGRQYIGGSLSRAEVYTSSRQDALNEIAPYPVGCQVSVFYNPTDPQDACLKTQTGPTFILPVVAGIAFILVGIVLLHYS